MAHNRAHEAALEDEIAGYLDHGLSKQETAKELGISVELIDAIMEFYRCISGKCCVSATPHIMEYQRVS